MDAVISIGGQSFVDGLVRVLGPGLQPLRDPLSIALPGIANGVLRIRSIQSVVPSAQGNTIELDLEVDLAAELVLVATVNAGLLNLALLPTVSLPASAGTVDQPLRTLSIDANNNAGTETGLVGTLQAALTLALKKLTGSLDAAAAAALNLGPVIATAQLPAGVNNIPLPLPAVVPVAVNFTAGGPLRARVFLPPIVNNLSLVGQDAPIDASTGFGLEFSFAAPTVQVDPFAGPAIAALQAAINNALNTVGTQLLPAPLQGLLTPPALNLTPIVNNITAAIPSAARDVLAEAFSGLRARTGRLIFPTPAAGSSCDVRALPTAGKARITFAANGSPILQVGVKRTALNAADVFPLFTPAGVVDTGVTITNAFVLALLECLVEKFPNLSLPTPAVFAAGAGGTPLTATWTGATLTAGPLAFTGTLVLAIAGVPGAPGPAVPKTITLTFTATVPIGAPLVIGPAITATAAITLPIAFDLNGLASITALRLSAAPAATFGLGLGTGLVVILAAAAVAVGILPAFVAGVAPISWAGFAALGSLIIGLPFIITGIVAGLLNTSLSQALGGLQRSLESPAALPPGIFEAFGKLVPTTMVVDDLHAAGVLQTPTSPWAVLPIIAKAEGGPRPGDGGGGRGPVPPPGTTPVAPGTGVPTPGTTPHSAKTD